MIKSFAITNDLNERLDLVLTNPEQSGIVVRSVTGLGPGKATLHIKEIANGDGGSYGGGRIPVRNIVMNLAFLGNPTIEDTRQLTYRFFPLKKQITLTVFTDNLEVNIDGIVESNDPDIFSNLEGCQISILCENPYFYTARDQITTSSGIFPMFEFPVDNELVEDPNTDKRIPSDQPYIQHEKIYVGEYSDDNIKYVPFSYYQYTEGANGSYYFPELISNATTTDTTGKIPFNTTYNDHNGRSGTFFLRFPFGRDTFKNDKRYTLSFLVDGEINKSLLSPRLAFVLDLVIYANRKIIYGSGEIQKTENGYARLPIASIYEKYSPNNILKNHSSENLRIDIPLRKDIIDSIYSYGLLQFLAKGTYIEKNGTSKTNEPMATYGYSMLIHDVFIYENDVEIRDGYAGEENYIYKWDNVLRADKDSSWYSYLFFTVVKEKMEWENINEIWRPKSDGGIRVFMLEFDMDVRFIKKANGSYSDYLSLRIRTKDENLSEMVTVGWYTHNDNGDWDYHTLNHYKITINESTYYDLISGRIDENNVYGDYISFHLHYNGNIGVDGDPTDSSYVELSNINFYEVLQPTTDQEILNKHNYLIDDSMPDYAFTQDGGNYNLKVSEGIIMGEIKKDGFSHLIRYEGNASIGFEITISFTHSLALFDANGLVGNPGYIVITSNYYPRKKMVIDLQRVYEIIQSVGENDGQVIPVTQPGDQIFIDTRKKKKSIRYQKPYDYTYTNSSGESVVWDHSGYKINVLAASNRDIEWFELHQGDNELTVRHASDPEIELEEDLENNHSEYLEVEVRNKIYYEGV